MFKNILVCALVTVLLISGCSKQGAGAEPSGDQSAEPLNQSNESSGSKYTAKDVDPRIVKAPIDPNTIMFLINAIYFKGDWAFPFNKSLTAQRPFILADGSRKSVPMMSQIFGYKEMEIVLPKK